MKKIKLTQNKFALVDDEDFNWLNQDRWFYDGRYAARWTGGRKNAVKVYLHRIVKDWFAVATSPKVQIDHIDRNSLNNQRKNLRLCTLQDNLHNYSPHKDSLSGYKGVCFNKRKGKWMVRIRNKFLGYFDNKTEAAKKYNSEAVKEYGEFAYLNKI
jgi:hypothetical protein